MTKLIKIQILIFSTILLFSGCAYYNTFYNAKKFYRDAEKERKKRERTQVVELSPEEQERLRKSGFGRGTELNRASSTEMQNYQRAVEKASKVLEFYPTSKYIDDAIMLLGECFYYRREYSKGLRKFEELVALYPNSEFIAEARLLMAKTYLGLEEYEEAESRLREYAINEKYKSELREEAKFELGTLYFNRGNFELATEHFQETGEKSDDKLIRAMSVYRLGECKINLKNFPEAINQFRKAIKLSPNDDFNSQSYFKLGESQSLNADYATAIKTFSRLLSKEFEVKRIPRIKFQLAENLRLNGEIDEATKWYENIIEEHQRTDASARSYYALGEMEEYVNLDYRKAREHYDMAKGQFASSAVVPMANKRSSNIKLLLQLEDEIAVLEGREAYKDSTDEEEGDSKNRKNERDDAAISLGSDGMWVNYSGRDRPPPKTLKDLTEEDMARAALLSEAQLAAITAADSTALLTTTVLDSAALAEKKAQEEADKKIQLSEKQLALAELLFFNFDKTDSSLAIYEKVMQAHTDTSSVIRALYSLGYIHLKILKDTTTGEDYLAQLIDFQPETEQALGAKKLLNINVDAIVDTASVYFTEAEKAIVEQQDLETAFGFYDKIITEYPESEWVPKAIFAKGYHYEQSAFELEKAANEYKILLADYPDSPFAKQVKPKMVAVEKIWKEEQARQKAIEDSISALTKVAGDSVEAALSDSLTKTLPDSLLSDTPILPGQIASNPDSMSDIRNILETPGGPLSDDTSKVAAAEQLAAPTPGLKPDSAKQNKTVVPPVEKPPPTSITKPTDNKEDPAASADNKIDQGTNKIPDSLESKTDENSEDKKLVQPPSNQGAITPGKKNQNPPEENNTNEPPIENEQNPEATEPKSSTPGETE